MGQVPPLVPGPYHIRLLGLNGALLANYPFTPKVSAEYEHLDMIAQVVDFVPSTRRIEIYSDEAGRPIESVPVSAHAPTVCSTSRTGEASLPACGSVRIIRSARGSA